MMTTIKTEHTTCPLSRKCDIFIRCLQPDGDYYSWCFGDDKDKPIDFEREMQVNFLHLYKIV